jgi:hypothetical protein
METIALIEDVNARREAAEAISKDKKVSQVVEAFLRSLPSTLQGPLVVCCKCTPWEWHVADRYMSCYMYLACWWEGFYQFRLCIRDNKGVLREVESSALLAIKQSSTNPKG